MSKTKRVSVAEYLSQQINICGKSQKEIAEEVGYDKPNMITMIKQGKTKLPINKVPVFAKSLGVDPVHMLRITMTEYMPDTWEVIEELIGQSALSASEQRVVEIIRAASGGHEISPQNAKEKAELAALADGWRARTEAFADAARRRAESDNRHMNQGNPLYATKE